MIKIGNTDIALYLGAQEASEVWLGGKKVYPNGTLEISPSSIAFIAAGASSQLSIMASEGLDWVLTTSGLSGWIFSQTSGSGPATITITAPNNRSTNLVSGSCTVIAGDLSEICYLSQNAGVQIFSAWENQYISLDTINFAATGGSSPGRMSISRTWTWNGVPGSGGTETSTSTFINYSSNDPIVSVNAFGITVGNLGTTVKGATNITITAASQASAVPKSQVVTQAANNITAYGVPYGVGLSVPNIPAGGGTVSSGTPTGSYTQSRTYTTGATDVFNPSPSSTWYSGAISAGSKGTSISGATHIGDIYFYYTCNGQTGSVGANVYQAANNVEFFHSPSIGGNNNNLPASGGTDAMYFLVYRRFSSGSDDIYYPTAGEWTMSGGSAGFSVNNGNKTVTAENRWQTRGDARSVYVGGTYGGQSAYIYVNQAHNNPTYTSSCSGYTLNERWRWPSGAPDTTASTPNSPSCGYIPPHYTLKAHLNTNWNVVQQIVGDDRVRVEFECGYGYGPFEVSYYQASGYWNANTFDLSWNTKNYNYWWGGAQGNSGGSFVWVGPAYIEISNRSGGLALFHATISVDDPNADQLALSANY